VGRACRPISAHAGGRTLAEPWYRAAYLAAIPAAWAYFSWRFEGLEKIPPEGPAIVACNHASYLDPIANAYAITRAGRRPRFLAKEDLFDLPVLGHAMRGSHQIPVQRGSKDPTPLRRAEEALSAGEVVVIYPEGTVTKRPDGLPMEGKTGVVRLSLASGVPITPMASWGSAAVWQKSGKGSLKPRRPVWVKVGDPLDLGPSLPEATDVGALHEMTALVMDAITDLVVDLRDRYPRRWLDEK
jgi:1-acyl-sn-glycerol-3-phosphate acyltransferase